MLKSSSRRIRKAFLTSTGLIFGAIAFPLACSSKAPEIEPGGVAEPCTSDFQCPGAHCDNGTCMPNCTPGGSTCGPTKTCGADGRCTDVGTGGTSPGTGGSSTGGTAIIDVPDSGPDGDGSLDPDAACGTGSARAMLTPVSMFVMFDRSTSMIENPPMPAPTRWSTASAALQSFFQDAEAADLAVALRFFPHDTPAAGCTGTGMPNCNSMACSQPLVPLMADPATPLPKLTADALPTDTHEQALVDAIMTSAPMPPGTGTPIYSALDGALTWATAYQAAHPRPEQQTVVVLVTDGEPTSCSADTRDVANIAMLAANALMASGVRTYAVGLSDSMTGLDFLTQIAMAGGGQAFFVMDGGTAAADLRAALKAIQGNALSCDFPFPEAEDGGMADPAKINVDYTPSTPPGSMPQRIFQVPDAAACGTMPGWYYDDPMMPTRIFLCPASCMTVGADMGAALDIQIGCTSIVRPPA